MAGLTIAGLRLARRDDLQPVVDDVTLAVPPGHVVGLAGGSGAGKTTLGRAALGRIRPGLVRVAGCVRLGDLDISSLDPDRLREVRGVRISLVAQHARSVLNPALRVATQLDSVIRAHRLERTTPDGHDRVSDCLESVLFPTRLLQRYPHELSGGELQRAALALALVGDPEVLVLDEPTTGLDAATATSILATVRRRSTERGLAVLLITHDLAALGAVAERVAVMHAGAIVEEASTAQVLTDPTHPYTRSLLAARPVASGRRPLVRPAEARVAAPPPPPAGLLTVHALQASHRGVEAVCDATFDVRRGEWLALVGPSGAGKTTLLRSIAGLHREWTGHIDLDGVALQPSVRRRPADLRRAIQLVLQNPDTAFNPRRTIGHAITRPLRLAGEPRGSARRAAVAALERVELHPDLADRHPDQLSGGERQRAAIARAIVGQPRLLLCDEVTSSLDPIVQAGIVALLESIRDELGLAIVFVTHDLALAKAVSDRTAVMDEGRLVEDVATSQLFDAPQHPRTRALLASLPSSSPPMT